MFHAPISLLTAVKQSSTVIESSGIHLQPFRAAKAANPSEFTTNYKLN